MAAPLKNMRWWDRVFRFGTSVIFLAWAIAGGPTWAYLSLALLATSSFGFCPVYWMFRRREVG